MIYKQNMHPTIRFLFPCHAACLMFEGWGANANAGASVGEKKTRQDCAGACAKSLTCIAADYDLLTKQCYLHTSVSNLRQRSTCCYRMEKLCNTQYSKCIHDCMYLWACISHTHTHVHKHAHAPTHTHKHT